MSKFVGLYDSWGMRYCLVNVEHVTCVDVDSREVMLSCGTKIVLGADDMETLLRVTGRKTYGEKAMEDGLM